MICTQKNVKNAISFHIQPFSPHICRLIHTGATIKFHKPHYGFSIAIITFCRRLIIKCRIRKVAVFREKITFCHTCFIIPFSSPFDYSIKYPITLFTLSPPDLCDRLSKQSSLTLRINAKRFLKLR